ncbi:MAG: CRTAC1 family protein [Planctomycetaceae bacterium]
MSTAFPFVHPPSNLPRRIFLAGCMGLGALVPGCREAVRQPQPAPPAANESARPQGGSTAGPTVKDSAGTSAASPPLDGRAATAKTAPLSNEQWGGVTFREVAAERGISLHREPRPYPLTILDSFGTGCAAWDANGDGWPDLLFVGAPHPVLYLNDGTGSFRDVTAQSGLADDAGEWTGCAVGDWSGDGRPDLLVTGYRRLALYRNQGEGRFEQVTAAAGLASDNEGHWGASAGFMDLDGDQWLDLVLTQYVAFGPQSRQHCEYKPGVKTGCTPAEYPPERPRVWRNTGEGRFIEMTATAGFDQSAGAGMVLAFGDVDADGRPDVYLGNDGRPADLLHNLGRLQFENLGLVAGVAVTEATTSMAAMGADWGDFDRDGHLDLAVTNFQKQGFALYRRTGPVLYADAAARTGLAAQTRSRLGFGVQWLDFDNDGWPDLACANGHVYDNAPELEGAGSSYRQPLSLLRNLEGQRFVDVVGRQPAAVRQPLVGRGLVRTDFNQDGRLDLVVVDHEGTPRLLENTIPAANHWLQLELRGNTPNQFAYGARVTGRAGDRVWVAELSPASSYLSSADPVIHWGLGPVPQLDEVTVRWPTGEIQTWRNVASRQRLRLEQQP